MTYHYLLRFIHPSDDFDIRFAALQKARPTWDFVNHGRIQEFSCDVELLTGIYSDDLGRCAWEVHPMVEKSQLFLKRPQSFVWYPDSNIDAERIFEEYKNQCSSVDIEDGVYRVSAPSLSAYYIADNLEHHGRILMC